ncbi:hypothetical protein PENTCL1PPCAC_4119, partial [Pristionchus entomophagus]
LQATVESCAAELEALGVAHSDSAYSDSAPSSDSAHSSSFVAASPPYDFSSLPVHLLDRMVEGMSYQEMAGFRLLSKKTHGAVAHWGRAQRALDIVRYVTWMWPAKVSRQEIHFETLYGVHKQLVKIGSWLDFDLITSID